MTKITCGDCGVNEGKTHLPACDMEHCSECGKQTLTWGNCLGAESEPFFKSILCCERCGKIFPEFFMVSDEEWKFICGVTYRRDCILCKQCMEFIKIKREELKDSQENDPQY